MFTCAQQQQQYLPRPSWDLKNHSLLFIFFLGSQRLSELRFPRARADKDDPTGAVRFNKQQLGGDSALQLPVSVIRDLALRLSAPRREGRQLISEPSPRSRGTTHDPEAGPLL